MEPQNFQPEPKPTPTCPYPREHEFLEYLGRYSPKPIWNRLSPFDCRGLLHKYEPRMDTYLRQGKRAEGFVPGNPFLWGMRIVGMENKTFFLGLPKNMKKKLKRGCYKVSVRTKTTESTKPFSLEDAKVTLMKGSGSITFDWYRALAGRDHSEFKFEWGQPLYVDIWILIRRIPCTSADSKFKKEIMFFIEVPLTKYLYTLPNLKEAIVDAEQKYNEIAHDYSLMHYGYPYIENVSCGETERFMRTVLEVEDGESFTCTSEVLDDRVSFKFTFSHPYYPNRCYEDHSQYFLEWYAQVLRGKVFRGCYNNGFDIRPWIMSIWTNLQEFFNSKFEEMRVENLSDNFVESFASKFDLWEISGESDPNVHLANETEIYSVFSKSVRNMPSKLNQWCLVDGKEPDPIPLVRHIKFPCQKAYSAFATKREADTEIGAILDLYRQFFEEFLAVPIIKGKTSELEKLADVLYTATIEVFIPESRYYYASAIDRYYYAWGIRGATAHCLGEKAMGWVNSWSCSIRAIGLMVMVHGDNKGLVLPPKVAPVQVIVIPGLKKSDIPGIHDTCNCIVDALCEAGIRAKADLDINESKVICKFEDELSDEFLLISTYWERKGVPLRIKVGSENDQLLATRRDNGAEVQLLRDSVSEQVKGILDDIQTNLFKAAKSKQEACIITVTSWNEFVKAFTFDSSKIVLAPWCDEEEVEKNVKSRIDLESFGLEVKTLCSPLEQPDIPEGTPCFFSGKPAKKWTYWGLSFSERFVEAL